jgi:hypothetical protein
MNSLSLADLAVMVQIAVGLVFLWSGVAKLAKPRGFISGLAQYGIVSPILAVSLGVALITLELVLAAVHLTGWFVAYGAIAGGGTFAAFTAVVAITLKHGRAPPCLCFGAASTQPISIHTVSRLMILLLAELLLVWLSWSGAAWPAAHQMEPREIWSAALGAIGGLLVASWLVAFGEAVPLWRRAVAASKVPGVP